jgi:hypothetical protein
MPHLRWSEYIWRLFEPFEGCGRNQIRFKIPILATYPSPRYLRRAAGHAVPRVRTVHRSADPLRRMQKVLALAQARKVDVILVTELVRWGRSARFAARSYRQNPNLLRLGANVDLRLDAIGPAF